jgi:hypothetical protein
MIMTDLRYARWFLPFSVPFGLGLEQSEVSVTDPQAFIAECAPK